MSDEIRDDKKNVSKEWIRPCEVMALHKLKIRKKALQARMNRTQLSNSFSNADLSLVRSSGAEKRKNPFLRNDENKRPKIGSESTFIEDSSESNDNVLFKLIHSSQSAQIGKFNSSQDASPLTSFSSVFNKYQTTPSLAGVIKTQGEKWIPIDWTLKNKLRLMSSKPFSWNRTLKTSEEASGITGFVRCLDTRTNTSLDTSPNAQFHECCLYWQHPSLPWLQLFPRSHGRVSATASSFASGPIKESLQLAWANSFRSLFQLVRARQCPYFYVCANNFTACFRAAGICGHSEMHVLLTPTTRGFRQLLRQEDIAFTMPLKSRRTSDGTVDLGYDTLDSGSNIPGDESQTDASSALAPEDEDEPPDDQWLESLGVNAEEIKKINSNQAKITHRTECLVDNSEQSLIFVEGVEAHGLYNFLINCKSIVASTGPLAGVPPTLLAPVAFHGATLQSLKVRENKIRDNNSEYYSIELSGPVLPQTLHNLYSLLPKDSSVTATFANILTTAPFSKVKLTRSGEKSSEGDPSNMSGSVVFGQENLSDCGFNKTILKRFCSANSEHFQHFDSLKYDSETGLYVWV